MFNELSGWWGKSQEQLRKFHGLHKAAAIFRVVPRRNPTSSEIPDGD
jgi:hypothetical protein